MFKRLLLTFTTVALVASTGVGQENESTEDELRLPAAKAVNPWTEQYSITCETPPRNDTKGSG